MSEGGREGVTLVGGVRVGTRRSFVQVIKPTLAVAKRAVVNCNFVRQSRVLLGEDVVKGEGLKQCYSTLSEDGETRNFRKLVLYYPRKINFLPLGSRGYLITNVKMFWTDLMAPADRRRLQL